MFARVLTLLPLALLVSASHLEARDQCTTGDQFCCDSVQTLDQANAILTGLGQSVVSAATQAGGLVGITCSSITGVGLGGNSCTQQTVCCTGNNFNGLVNVGCSPISI